VRLSFTLRDLPGRVEVGVEPNAAPETLGCAPHAEGFPVCTATVEYAGAGYAAALGWIQLVRSTGGADAGASFEMDPFEALGRLTHPFCWFGFAPTLFDAPSRPSRVPLEWTAHSFLAYRRRGARGASRPGLRLGLLDRRRRDLDRGPRPAGRRRVGRAPAAAAPRASRLGLRPGYRDR
jgi:hypothetical protein